MLSIVNEINTGRKHWA